MAFSYQINQDSQIITVVWEGAFTLDEVNSSLDGMYNDGEYQATFSGIADVRKADFQLTPAELKINHDFVKNHKKCPKGPWAVICDEPYQTALALLYEKQYKTPHPVDVFTTFEAAQAWLSSVKNESR